MARRTLRLIACVAGAAAVASASTWLAASGRGRSADVFAPPRIEQEWPAQAPEARRLRDAALRRAAVWRPSNIESADLSTNPPDPSGTLSEPVVVCRFFPRPSNGTTPKFDCVLRDGEVVKVKYGRNPEIHAEAAASRLLTALGFGADRIYARRRAR